MNFHWLHCCDSQGQFRYIWWPGMENLVDYWTKHYPESHKQNFCPKIIMPRKYLDTLCGLHKMKAPSARVS